MADKPIPIITQQVEDRFWSRIDKSPGQGPDGDCWQWIGTLAPDGYPKMIRIAGQRYRVGQVSLYVSGKQPLPDKPWALHSCDNPTCARPDHLRWGSLQENIADACERGTGGRRGFTPDEVRAIRSSPLRHSELAVEFGTSSACILNIRKRVSHKHVD